MIAILTGAGISTESGIPDYRGPDGTWTNDPASAAMVEVVPYLTDTHVRRQLWATVRGLHALRPQPNAAHLAIAALHASGVPVRVLTQNVDGLHQAAGMTDVLELHGSAHTVTCFGCGAVLTLDQVLALAEPDPPCRRCGGVLRPAVTFFGEMLDPDVLARAEHIAAHCRLMIAAGTSLLVTPAAALVTLAVQQGAKLIIINAEPTPYDELADVLVRERAGTALPALLDSI